MTPRAGADPARAAEQDVAAIARHLGIDAGALRRIFEEAAG